MTPLQRSSHALLCYRLSLTLLIKELSEFTWEHSYLKSWVQALKGHWLYWHSCNYCWRSRFPIWDHMRLILWLLWLHLISPVAHVYRAPLCCESHASRSLHAGQCFQVWCGRTLAAASGLDVCGSQGMQQEKLCPTGEPWAQASGQPIQKRGRYTK